MSSGRNSLRLEIRTLNRLHIAAAFGDDAAEAVQCAMVDTVSCYILGNALICAIVGLPLTVPGFTPVCRIDEDVIVINLQDWFSPNDVYLLIDGISRALTLNPVRWGDAFIHAAPFVRPTKQLAANIPNDRERTVLNSIESEPHFGGGPVFKSNAWRDRYRRDMAAAAQLFTDLAADELKFASQSTRMPGQFSSRLYSDAPMRAPGFGEALRDVGFDVGAVERLGLIRAVDNLILWRAIDCLQSDSSLRLVVNISGQSACRDGWWAALECQLKGEASARATVGNRDYQDT